MLCCKLNRRGRGSDSFLISAQNIDAGESQGGSHTWLFSQRLILCSDVNIMKLSLVILVKNQELAFYRHYKESFEYEEN